MLPTTQHTARGYVRTLKNPARPTPVCLSEVTASGARVFGVDCTGMRFHTIEAPAASTTSVAASISSGPILCTQHRAVTPPRMQRDGLHTHTYPSPGITVTFTCSDSLAKPRDRAWVFGRRRRWWWRWRWREHETLPKVLGAKLECIRLPCLCPMHVAATLPYRVGVGAAHAVTTAWTVRCMVPGQTEGEDICRRFNMPAAREWFYLF